ncbi:hypothetical protein BGX34_011360 [Mortierella sp. NVP85]|nr:hypothetical protein BGX34_011360 [Mortierella sp. NVP85]
MPCKPSVDIGTAQTIPIVATPLIPNIGNSGSTRGVGGGAGAGTGTGGGRLPDGALPGGIGAIAHLIPGVGAVSNLLPLIPVIGGLLGGGGGLVNTPAGDVQHDTQLPHLPSPTTASTSTAAVTPSTIVATTTSTAGSAAGSKTLAPTATASLTPNKQNGSILGWLTHLFIESGTQRKYSNESAPAVHDDSKDQTKYQMAEQEAENGGIGGAHRLVSRDGRVSRITRI